MMNTRKIFVMAVEGALGEHERWRAEIDFPGRPMKDANEAVGFILCAAVRLERASNASQPLSCQFLHYPLLAAELSTKSMNSVGIIQHAVRDYFLVGFSEEEEQKIVESFSELPEPTPPPSFKEIGKIRNRRRHALMAYMKGTYETSVAADPESLDDTQKKARCERILEMEGILKHEGLMP